MTNHHTPLLPHSSNLSRMDMERVAVLILGGGSGTRLFPLTLSRCKPAVCFGGRYRLIDIPMSNALNNGCKKIYIFTQFLSSSLHQHILKTYRMETHSKGFVEILSAEQKPSKAGWYQGTADAIRHHAEYISECDVDYFLILSGDQLYQMDFAPMLALAEETKADLVVSACRVKEEIAKRMGILKMDTKHCIVDFVEKPQSKAALQSFRMDSDDYLGSMGIYLFKRQALLDLLHNDIREDFGKHLIPTQVQKGSAAALAYDGYWEDIGTIDTFYKANMALTGPQPAFNLFTPAHPIHTAYHSLPPPRIEDTQIKQSLICEGAEISAQSIYRSIIGPRTRIGKNSVIEDSYLFGNGYDDKNHSVCIGNTCVIRKALVDNQVRIGNNVKLINKDHLLFYEKDSIYIRDGVMIVTRGAVIPDNFIL